MGADDLSTDPLALWAASGAMWLSGRADGPPLAAPGSPALAAAVALHDIARDSATRTGTVPALPTPRILGERAAIAGLGRRGPWSCGGAFRAVPTTDGFFGLSLARPDDLAMVQALVSAEFPGAPWDMVTEWARTTTAADAVARAQLLGLPAAGWPAGPVRRPGVLRQTLGVRGVTERPIVMDLTSLWAGPLCAHLLGLGGCRVIKIESTRRPDGARRGPRGFFDLLHGGHESVALDFTDPVDQARLRDLLSRADVVLEASRPRALEGLGIDAAQYVADGAIWVSITARGRDVDAVGFGDDVAVAAGLARVDGPDLLPVGDALADPLTGVAAAAATARALTGTTAELIDVSMIDVAAATVGPVPEHTVVSRDDQWWLDTGGALQPVAEPTLRAPTSTGPELGEHNEAWL